MIWRSSQTEHLVDAMNACDAIRKRKTKLVLVN